MTWTSPLKRLLAALSLGLMLLAPAFAAGAQGFTPEAVLSTRYRLVLELVRHTPTYSPPVASRAFAYLGVTAHEALVGGEAGGRSLAGQLNGLTPLPVRPAGTYDEAAVLDEALAIATEALFVNTGPTGQRAMLAMRKMLSGKVDAELAADVVARSRAQGAAIARHVLDWSKGDGGDPVENMGFPQSWAGTPSPGTWTPTSAIRQQQAPLLPRWGENRPFAMPKGMSCRLPPPPAYSEDKGSAFYAEAMEVYETVKNLTPEQKAIARFWSDDPMLSPTPPGHWIAIARSLIDQEKMPVDDAARLMARLGIALADAFIGCWDSKYTYNLIRPISYIKKQIDPAFEPLLITPPFPEYPSGHSSQSGAAARVLADAFGENFAFDDHAHEDDNLPARRFASFDAAASEAAVSRIYGGIHFRSAAERGLEQGHCIGTFAVKLEMGR